jgi:thiosulfate/3-mercaptopyruvate sulfurtransferase
VALLFASPLYATGKSGVAESIFVSALQLRDLIGKPGVKVIDVRSAGDYTAGHIPGAISIPWHTILVPERDGFRNKWADDTVIEEVFARAGLSYADYLVLYHEDALGGGIPFVIFSYAGFDELHALDGGIEAWDGKIDAMPVTPAASKFTMSRKHGWFMPSWEEVLGT